MRSLPRKEEKKKKEEEAEEEEELSSRGMSNIVAVWPLFLNFLYSAVERKLALLLMCKKSTVNIFLVFFMLKI